MPTSGDESPTLPLWALPGEWIASTAIGVVLIALAAITWAVPAVTATLGLDWLSISGWPELAAAVLRDVAAATLAAGLLLVRRPIRAARVAAIAAAAGLVALRAIDYATMVLPVGPDAASRRLAAAAGHVAMAGAFSLALVGVAGHVRPASAALARFTGRLAIAWPAVAAIAALIFGVGPARTQVEDLVLNPPLALTVVVEAGVWLATLAVLGRAEAMLLGVWRTGSRRRADGLLPPDVGDDADRCARCGYDLDGTPADGVCPECGLLAERSRTTSPHLRDAPPAWLRRIALGAALIAAAQVFAAVGPWAYDAFVQPRIVWPILSTVSVRSKGRLFTYTASFPGTSPSSPTLFGIPVNVALLELAPWAIAAALLAAGAWLTVRPARRGSGASPLRSAIRLLSIVPLAAVAGLALTGPTAVSTRRAPLIISIALLATATLAIAPLPALLFAHLRLLARRALNANLDEHATIVAVGYSLTLVATPLAFALAGPDWPSQTLPFVYVLAGLTVLLLLFALWSVANCVRFAVAFARAARQAEIRWRDADRAAA